jgi:hypothetical protein
VKARVQIIACPPATSTTEGFLLPTYSREPRPRRVVRAKTAATSARSILLPASLLRQEALTLLRSNLASRASTVFFSKRTSECRPPLDEHAGSTGRTDASLYVQRLHLCWVAKNNAGYLVRQLLPRILRTSTNTDKDL